MCSSDLSATVSHSHDIETPKDAACWLIMCLYATVDRVLLSCLCCNFCRSKNERLARYNIHELVQGTASAAQRQLLYDSYAQAETLQRRIDELKSSLMQE